MKTIAEYAEKFRTEYPFRYAIAFGEMEGALTAGDDLVEQMRLLQAALKQVEDEQS